MSKVIKEPSTLLVLEGIPYSLVRHEPIDYCSPCEACDLSDLCWGQDAMLNLRKLCTPKGLDESYFFEIDWDIVEKQIIDYTHFNIDQVSKV